MLRNAQLWRRGALLIRVHAASIVVFVLASRLCGAPPKSRCTAFGTGDRATYTLTQSSAATRSGDTFFGQCCFRVIYFVRNIFSLWPRGRPARGCGNALVNAGG